MNVANARTALTMTRKIKFTPSGIPYVTEFENVSFAPNAQDHRRTICTLSLSSTSSFCYIENPPPQSRFSPFSLRSASAFFKRKHPQSPHTGTFRATAIESPPDADDTKPLPPFPPSDPIESHGIYIRLPSERIRPHTSRKERLVHLQQTISLAVLDAGMSSSPSNLIHPEKHPSERALHRTRGYKTPDALFCGTYGQLMTALEAAGLSAIPCIGEGLSGYTRLGALFVARNDGASGGVQLRKITLWA